MFSFSFVAKMKGAQGRELVDSLVLVEGALREGTVSTSALLMISGGVVLSSTVFPTTKG